ncbi:MAG: CDF family Co(II)/Ni(II) efflux transporter DmeF [Verrucomicrobia bacterium]|nr:CDF family Co(II)/Ni(II) efflux transporter DmeF [Verrucomicrobiota bacterium]
MHIPDISRWKHHHNFVGDFSTAERNTKRVIALTATMMVVEIAAGIKFNSMALLADGWHMSTHVAAFMITAWAYSLARRHANNARFSFGTGKIGVLGAFTSAIVLAGVALMMGVESVHRFLEPAPIRFNEAILVACVGLAVNVVSAFILKDHHHHGHSHEGHNHAHTHQDVNLKAAYIHVIADAFTSVLAIGALFGGKFFGWNWLDPAMGIVGGIVIACWAYGLVRQTVVILLDQEPEHSDLNEEIYKAIEGVPDTKISDLHIWQVGVNKFAAIISVVTHEPKSPDWYKQLLREHEELVHVTVEVHHCDDHPV